MQSMFSKLALFSAPFGGEKSENLSETVHLKSSFPASDILTAAKVTAARDDSPSGYALPSARLLSSAPFSTPGIPTASAITALPSCATHTTP